VTNVETVRVETEPRPVESDRKGHATPGAAGRSTVTRVGTDGGRTATLRETRNGDRKRVEANRGGPAGA